MRNLKFYLGFFVSLIAGLFASKNVDSPMAIAFLREDELMASLTNGFDGNEYMEFDQQINSFVGYDNAMKTLMGRIKQFDFTITNRTGIDLGILLHPGYLRTERAAQAVTLSGASYYPMVGGGYESTTDAAGTIKIFYDSPVEASSMVNNVNCVLADGTIYVDSTDNTKKATVTTSGSKKVRQLTDFLRLNPAVLETIDLNANDKLVFSGEITIKPLSPFTNSTGEETLKPEDWLSPQNLQDKKVIVKPSERNMVIQLDQQTAMAISIPGSVNNAAFVQLKVQFNFTEIYNNAAIAMQQISALRVKKGHKV